MLGNSIDRGLVTIHELNGQQYHVATMSVSTPAELKIQIASARKSFASGDRNDPASFVLLHNGKEVTDESFPSVLEHWRTSFTARQLLLLVRNEFVRQEQVESRLMGSTTGLLLSETGTPASLLSVNISAQV